MLLFAGGTGRFEGVSSGGAEKRKQVREGLVKVAELDLTVVEVELETKELTEAEGAKQKTGDALKILNADLSFSVSEGPSGLERQDEN